MEVNPVEHELNDIQLTGLALIQCSVTQIELTDTKNQERFAATCDDLKISRGVINDVVKGQPVNVVLKVEIGTEVENPLFRIVAQLVGQFQFPESTFEEEKVIQWSKTNGYLLLLPFLREILLSGTRHLPSGPYIVPLIPLPTQGIDKIPTSDN